jgi:hypothetical protein
MNGTDLLLRDFNVFCTTKTNHRAILDQLKQMAMTNNTTGATIYDLGNIVKAESIAEVSDILKEAEAKQQQQQQQQQKQQQDMQSQQLQAQAQEKQAERDFQANENEKERQKDIMVAEIRGASFSGQVDMDQNQQGDFKDAMQDIRKRDEYREQMNFKREESAQRNATDQAKMGIEREKLATQRDIANKNLEIARENKNKYDVQSKSKDKKK